MKTFYCKFSTVCALTSDDIETTSLTVEKVYLLDALIHGYS